MTTTYSIRTLSREFDVTARTLRFYEAEGILHPERRGTTRLFSDQDRERLTLALRGSINHVAAWDVGHPAPSGTMRGTPTLNAGVSAGATTLVLATGQPGATLLQGDKIQLGTGLGTSQMVMVLLDAVANGSGVLTVTTEPPLRLGFAGGTAVTWNRPRAYFKQSSARSTWSYAPSGVVTGMSIDLLEAWQ